jgi:hypothetical protein
MMGLLLYASATAIAVLIGRECPEKMFLPKIRPVGFCNIKFRV